ncbi:neurotensin receptor type 1 [Xenopus laevis]|uniref:Neurotensin receptor type 1 n=2 Tax=Xenopus laevis TaxID=8355 RepID=A0A8J1KRU7_XENLA|nr:neurotensin receptor type 1 [Xenopus laevis]
MGMMWTVTNLTFPVAEPNSTSDLSHQLDVDTDFSSKVFITVFYILIFLVGTIGNVLTIRLVLKKHNRHKLQGTVHYHLVSMALSDILILLISIPIELYNFIWVHYPWIFGDAVCRSYYFLRDICSYATVLNITSLSCERYLAICHPMTAKRIMSKMRTKKILSVIWFSSVVFAMPMAFIMGVKYENTTPEGEEDPSSLICTNLVSTATLKVFIQVNVFVSFLLPLALISCLNCVTVNQLESLRSRYFLSLHSSSKAPQASYRAHMSLKPIPSSPVVKKPSAAGATCKSSLTVSSEPNRIQPLQHSIYMLRAIVIAYVVCWLPYHARRLMFCYIPDDYWTGFLYTFYHYFYMLTNTLFYVSSAVNPILYNMVSSSFRELFLETLGFSRRRKEQNLNPSVSGQTSLRSDTCAHNTQANHQLAGKEEAANGKM